MSLNEKSNANLESSFFFKQIDILDTVFFILSTVAVLFSIAYILAEDTSIHTLKLLSTTITIIRGVLLQSTFCRILMYTKKVRTYFL